MREQIWGGLDSKWAEFRRNLLYEYRRAITPLC